MQGKSLSPCIISLVPVFLFYWEGALGAIPSFFFFFEISLPESESVNKILHDFTQMQTFTKGITSPKA